MCIGLPENLYSPVITNLFVGSAGDSVPLPLTAKLIMELNIVAKPIAILLPQQKDTIA